MAKKSKKKYWAGFCNGKISVTMTHSGRIELFTNKKHARIYFEDVRAVTIKEAQIMNDRDPDHLQQKVLDRASESTGDYQCKQCGERHNEERRMWCYYCEQRICPKCKIVVCDPVTDDEVEVCAGHAEKVQKIRAALRAKE